jgi:hypothetical protein
MGAAVVRARASAEKALATTGHDEAQAAIACVPVARRKPGD